MSSSRQSEPPGNSSTSKSKIDSTRKLEDVLSMSLVASEFKSEQSDFAPDGLLEDLISHDTVRATFAVYKIDQNLVGQDIVDYIVSKGRKLFAICVVSNMDKTKLLKAMKLFRDESITDRDLPLSLPPYLDPNKVIWGPSTRKSFERGQWTFLAPRFSTTEDTQDLDRSSILPFTERIKGKGRGSYGSVSKIKVQEGHMKDGDSSNRPCSYALKHIYLNQGAEISWTKELANLRAVTGLQHHNMLRFITAFRQKEDDNGTMGHYLICEWANGGSLLDFWKSAFWKDIAKPLATPSLVNSVVTQLTGLTDALYTLHYSSKLEEGIVHGDLKPENILLFRPEGSRADNLGTLKIGDWGLSKEKDCKTTNQAHPSYFIASIKYEPPERSRGVPVVNRDGLLRARSRLYDIWSFGCVMLEFIVWLIEGPRGLDELNGEGIENNSRFWETKRGAHLGSSPQLGVCEHINKKMDSLEKSPACGEALRHLLRLVRDRALVVHLPTTLAALEDDDLKGLSDSDKKRIKPVEPATQQINSVTSYTSTDPHKETFEMVTTNRPRRGSAQMPDIELTAPDEPYPASDRPQVYTKGQPRAKATELLVKMREIKSAADQHGESTAADYSGITEQTARLRLNDNAIPRSFSLLDSCGNTSTELQGRMGEPGQRSTSGGLGVERPQEKDVSCTSRRATGNDTFHWS